jgi:drug/metabolite transporter (DMT)-like permease
VPTLQADDEQDTENPASSRPALLFQGGAELGTYLFLGNLLQIIALKTVPADRAGFLVQTTTVMVPLVDAALTGRPVPAKTWLACLLAFAGVVVMNLNGDSGPFLDALSLSDVQEAFTSFSVGDALILLAAVSYSMHVVRLGGYAKELAPLNLAASKATVEATLSLCLVALLLVGADSFDDETSGLLAYATEAGHEIATFFATMKESLASDAIPSSALLPAVGAVFWTGWVTCAYTIYAQSFGQRRVQPVTANLIYTVQPLFTALFAWMLLGETLGPAGVAGGSFIAAAVYMVAMTDGSSQNDRAENSLASLGTEEDEAIENLTKINGETCQEFVER